MKNIILDVDVNQWMLINRKKYNVFKEKKDLIIGSNYKDDDNIYINMERNSLLSHMNNVINMVREHDIDMLKKLKLFNINVPEYIYCGNFNDYLSLMKDNKNYMLKSFDSARSLGQMVVTRETIFEAYTDMCGLKWEEFNEKYKIDTRTAYNDIERSFCHSALANGKFYLSEEQKFDKEYRFLYFDGIKAEDMIIEERYGYKVNSDEERSHKVIDINDDKFLCEIGQKLIEFGICHTSPMLSFDVWVTGDEWGLFEYSTQFGCLYTGYNKKLFLQFNKALELNIKNLKK